MNDALREFASGVALLLELYERDNIVDTKHSTDAKGKFMSALHGICKAVAESE